jgi:hypothetical protein
MFIFINVFLYRYLIQIILVKRLFRESYSKIDKHIIPAYNVGLVGGIGAGKTTNGVSFVQMVELLFIQKMEERSYKIELLLKSFVDFVDYEEYFIENFCNDQVYTKKMYYYFAYKYLKPKLKIAIHLLYPIKDNSFNDTTLLDLLAEYTELSYYRIYRKNNVLSNTTIESVNTGLNSMPVQESYLQMYRYSELAHEQYLVQLFDEAGATDNSRVNARLDKKSVEQNDDGKDVDAMFQRHGSKGNGLRINIGQSEKDVTANRRRLWNITIELFQSKEIYIFRFEMLMLNWFYHYLKALEYKKYVKKMRWAERYVRLYDRFNKDIFLKKSKKLTDKYFAYLKVPNTYKKLMLPLNIAETYLGKYLYKIQYMLLHRSADNVGKDPRLSIENKGSMLMYICYPADITYGRFDTFAYFVAYDKKNESAKVPLSQLKPFDKKRMTERDIRRMNYRLLNRIFDTIDSQEVKSTNTSQKKKKMTNYDVFN